MGASSCVTCRHSIRVGGRRPTDILLKTGFSTCRRLLFVKTGRPDHETRILLPRKTRAFYVWWVLRVSNPRPSPCKGDALPLS